MSTQLGRNSREAQLFRSILIQAERALSGSADIRVLWGRLDSIKREVKKLTEALEGPEWDLTDAPADLR